MSVRLIFVAVLTVLLLPITAWSSCVTLTWTATGDDGYVGQASLYDLRLSTDSAFLVNNFTNAAPATWLPLPQAVGGGESYIVTGLQTGVRYFFALRVGDESANWSGTSNVVARVASESACDAAAACLSVEIESVGYAIQGQPNEVDLFLQMSDKPLQGFDVLVGYDPNDLTMIGVRPGALLANCDWAYFSYSLNPVGPCATCPSGMVRVQAIAETNGSSVWPSCYMYGQSGAIATLDFLIGTGARLECEFLPVSFFWPTCTDNSFTSVEGDTLWVSRRVSTYNQQNITNATYGLPGAYGIPNTCLPYDESQPISIRCADFRNGGFQVICRDSGNSRGDVNLNGLPYEASDCVVFSNYFVRGFDAFWIDVAAQSAATDVNGDGIPLTIGDLVHFVRILTGDLTAPKVDPSTRATVEVTHRAGLVSLDTDRPVGAVHFVVNGEAEPELHSNAVGLSMQFAYDGTNTQILIWDISGESFLESGPVLWLDDDQSLQSIEAAGIDGTQMRSRLLRVPTTFKLDQNYPNPFNPKTEIRFGLPTSSRVTLEIFNVAGQRVSTLVDEFREAGQYTEVWEGSGSASGVYFYRLRAGDFISTKKMILLK